MMQGSAVRLGHQTKDPAIPKLQSMALQITSVEEAIGLLHSSEFRTLWSGSAMRRYGFRYPFGLCFRGHDRVSWELTPSIFRKKSTSKLPVYEEASMFFHFQLRHPEYSNREWRTFDWLCLMQHYRLPTRLLDWTESILVALYFACADNAIRQREDGALFALNPIKLNMLSDFGSSVNGLHNPRCLNVAVRSELAVVESIEELLIRFPHLDIAHRDGVTDSEVNAKLSASDPKWLKSLSAPVGVFPFRSNARMSAQSSIFTLHGGFARPFRNGASRIDPSSLETLNASMSSARAFMLRITVPATKKKEILDTLRMLGVHEASLFPELEHQTIYIRDQWKRGR